MEIYSERNILKAIKKRKKLIFFFSFLVFIVSIIKVLFFPIYESSAIILIDYPKKETTSMESEYLPLKEYISYVGTQGALMTNRPVIEKVIEDLKLARPNLPGRKRQWEKIVRKFQNKYVSVKTTPLSPLVTVTVQYSNPEMAAEIANKIIQVYKNWNADFQHSGIDKLIEYLDKETKLSKERLQGLEENLRKFREANEIIALPEQVKTQLQVAVEEFKAYYQVIQETEVKLLESELELSRLRELYTDNSPQVIYAKERVSLVKDKLDKEIQKYKLNENYLKELKYVPEKEIMLGRFMRDVKINEAQYTFLSEELEKAHLLKAKQTTENIKIVSSAVVPSEPKEGVLHVVLNTLAGIIVAFALAIFLEARSLFIPY